MIKRTTPCTREWSAGQKGTNGAGKRHRWKGDRCIYCRKTKKKVIRRVCDCGCGKTLPEDESEIVRYKKKAYIYGHETLSLFDQILAVNY